MLLEGKSRARPRGSWHLGPQPKAKTFDLWPIPQKTKRGAFAISAAEYLIFPCRPAQLGDPIHLPASGGMCLFRGGGGGGFWLHPIGM